MTLDPLNIRRLRARLGWTQLTLAKSLGVSQALISAWESGKRTPGGPAKEVLRSLLEQTAEVDETSSTLEVTLWETLLKMLARDQSRSLDLELLESQVSWSTRQELVDALIARSQDLLMSDFDRRIHLYSERGWSRPTLAAYVDLTFDEGPTLSSKSIASSILRSAMLVDPSRQKDLATWYQGVTAFVLQESAPEERAKIHTLLLACDAIWLMGLLGWLNLSGQEASGLQEHAWSLVRAL